ncbi:phage regulatory protein/antirepressor Ant [Paenibacillus sp. FSL R10-2734]|uniref:phage regulatory protein/antirepressor Ant n=1 Tax=Paenibacillus sp. FSL R10-2734 TaxID=2954691 RepID=UPI0030D89C2C
MNQLRIVSKDGKLLADSREIAFMTGKDHSNIMRDIRGYVSVLENSDLNSQDFFIPNTYKTEGNNKTYDCYLLTKIGCDMVANKMTGEKGILFTATYVSRFEEMERQIITQETPSYMIVDPVERAKKWISEEESRKLFKEKSFLLELQVEQDKPKTIFADAVSTSNDSILVGQLATILKQNGVNIGQTRLFNFLREEGYLCKSGERRNLPTQKAMELKLFEVKEFTVHGNSGIRVKNTPKVTGRGQIYFINKFLKHSA